MGTHTTTAVIFFCHTYVRRRKISASELCTMVFILIVETQNLTRLFFHSDVKKTEGWPFLFFVELFVRLNLTIFGGFFRELWPQLTHEKNKIPKGQPSLFFVLVLKNNHAKLWLWTLYNHGANIISRKLSFPRKVSNLRSFRTTTAGVSYHCLLYHAGSRKQKNVTWTSHPWWRTMSRRLASSYSPYRPIHGLSTYIYIYIYTDLNTRKAFPMN